MFCVNCGENLEEKVIICPKCGKDNEMYAGGSTNTVSSNDLQVDSTGRPEPTPLEQPKKSFSGKKAVVGGLIAIVAIVVLIVFMTQPKTYNLEEYIELNYSGYDGYANADASLDSYTLLKDIFEDRGQSSDIKDYNSFSSLGVALSESIALEKTFSSIDLVISSKSKGLSNGDTITVDIEYDNSVAKQSDIKFKGKSVELYVEGLDPVKEIDPFLDVEVSYSGISPSGSLDFVYSSDTAYVSQHDFTIDKGDGLRNGDIVTISVNAEDEFTLDRGFVITQKEKQYTVSGLNEYVESYDHLTEEFISSVRTEAEDAVYSYTANKYSSTSSLADLEYCGYILNSVKNGSESNKNQNSLYVIFTGTVSSSAGNFATSTVYFPVRFTNIMIGDDGLSYGDIDGVAGNSSIDGTRTSTNGYINPYTCYMEIVDANRETHNSEIGDGFEKYANYENIATLSDISKEFKESLFADARDRVESYIASKYSSTMQASDVSDIGEYLLLAKTQGTDFGANNRYIVVLSAEVTSTNGRFEPTTVYYPVGYYGLVKLPDNDFMITATKGILGNNYFPGTMLSSTNGYTDGEEMFSKLITANRDNYTYEVSEGLKELGE